MVIATSVTNNANLEFTFNSKAFTSGHHKETLITFSFMSTYCLCS